jgi:hypothetical protein
MKQASKTLMQPCSTPDLEEEELGNQPRRVRQSPLEPEPFLHSLPGYRYVHG